jgi:hypothetical protein
MYVCMRTEGQKDGRTEGYQGYQGHQG